MQNVHVLSHPIMIVTHAEWSTSRRTGRVDGISPSEGASSRISVIGPHSSA